MPGRRRGPGPQPAPRRSPAAKSTARRTVKRQKRRTRRRRLVVGGAVILAGGAAVHKLTSKDAQKIEEHTGLPPEDLTDEDLAQAMQELNIQDQPLTDEDKAALTADQAANPDAYEAEAATPSATEDDTISQLERLATLRDQGILTEEEFEAQKKKVLGL